jgi:hypothetical protein
LSIHLFVHVPILGFRTLTDRRTDEQDLSVVHVRFRAATVVIDVTTAVRSRNLQAPAIASDDATTIVNVATSVRSENLQAPTAAGDDNNNRFLSLLKVVSFPQIHRHYSSFRKSPSSRVIKRIYCAHSNGPFRFAILGP